MPKRSVNQKIMAVALLCLLLLMTACGEKGAPDAEGDSTVPDVANGGMIPSEETIADGAVNRNLPGLAQIGVETDLTVYLADRFGRYNNLKKDISVHIVTENGLATNTGIAREDGVTVVKTDEFGKALVKLRTQKGLNNIDSTVSPSAWHTELADEVRGYTHWLDSNKPNGALGRSIISVLYYTRGEEEFDDANDNGIRDPDEVFSDTPDDPFLDTNENGVFDPLEKLIDVDGDGSYSGPNGVWDNNKMIYRNTHFLINGRPRIGSSVSSFAVGNNGSANIDIIVCDENFQHLSNGSVVTITSSAGTLSGTTTRTYGTSFLTGTSKAGQLALIQFPVTITDSEAALSTSPTAELKVSVSWEGETIEFIVPGTVL